MDIHRFLDNYSDVINIGDKTNTWNTQNPQTEYLFSNYGGLSVGLGVFRIHTYTSSFKWTKIITDSFSNYKDKIIAFGFDWLGRQYAIHITDNLILMFDISTGEDYKLETNIEDFLSVDLVEYANDTIQTELFSQWIKSKEPLKSNQIVGFKIPLFLGGKDSPDNFEIIDAEVDWEINHQLKDK